MLFFDLHPRPRAVSDIPPLLRCAWEAWADLPLSATSATLQEELVEEARWLIGHTLSLKLRRRPRDVGLITSPPQRCLPSTQRTLWTLCKDATRHGPAEWPEGDGGAHATIELASLVSIASLCGTDDEGRGLWACEDWHGLVSHLPAPRGTQVEDLPARRSDGSEFIIPAGGEVIAVDISGAFRNCLIYLDPGSGLVACMHDMRAP